MPDLKGNHEAKGVIEFMNVEALELLKDGTIGLVGNAILRGEDESRKVILKCAVQSIIPLTPSPHSYGNGSKEKSR